MPAPWLEGSDVASQDGEDSAGRPSALRRLCLSPLGLVSHAYSLGARTHRAIYRGGWAPTRRLPCKVVSVGSLMVGGSGKTPVAAWVASRLHARGRRVVLATRGYRATGRDPVHVLTDGRRIHGDVTAAGDEPLVLAAHAPGVPVLVGRDRSIIGLRAVSAFGAEVVVLDDGFQHHRLVRNVDIVTFDARFGFGNRRVLPRGPLREPLSSLRRAHAVGIVDGQLSEPDASLLEQYAVNPFFFEARRRPSRVRSIRVPRAGKPRQSEPATALAGARVGLLAALGQPSAFRASLEACGATVVAERVFRDHHRYRARDLARLEGEADIWVTTEKDAVKILPRWANRIDLRVLTIELAVANEAAFLDWLEERIR